MPTTYTNADDRVSWILPVRDGRRWLREAALSALDDSRDDDELIVIDDGSSDDPGAALPDDPRVRLIHQPPSGIVAALERGRAAARGPYLARLDADDRSLPGRLAAQRAALRDDPTLGVVGGQARIRRDDGPVPEGMRRYVAWLNDLRDPHAVLLVESPLFHPAVMVRAAALAQVGGYRDGDFPEDYDLWLRLAGARWRLRNLERRVVVLRDRSDRLTRADPRYRRAAFRQLKMEWLVAHHLQPGMRVVVWGGGREGRPWIRWLRARGMIVPAVVDLRPGVRQGVPVITSEALPGVACDRLIAAVGARGARALIRARLRTLRPDLVEGSGWWAVA